LYFEKDTHNLKESDRGEGEEKMKMILMSSATYIKYQFLAKTKLNSIRT